MDDAIKAFVNTLVLIGMFVALMLPILAVPYLFIKMGSVAGKVQAKMNGMTKSRAQRSAPAKALQQRRNLKDSARSAKANKMLNSRLGRATSRGFTTESKSAYDRFQEQQNKKEIGDHMAVMRTHAPEKLAKTAIDKSKSRNEREAAMQLIAQQGHGKQIMQLNDYFTSGAGASDNAGKAAFAQTKVDNFAGIKKEAPAVVGKNYGDLSQEEILGMSKEAFGDAMRTSTAAQATYAAAAANPRLAGNLKGHHKDYTNTGTLPPPVPPIT